MRDHLLELPIRERDWVVVGSDPQAMQNAGFRAVGKDFPVFLHPESGEEFALARTERKTGLGYGGFSFHTAPDVTLEDDLKRRDLSINAIAMNHRGELVDPWNGASDLADRRLRAVSDHFSEDPLRLLRLARFYARFFSFGFSLDSGTRKLLESIVTAGELEHLTPERVWKETERALMCDHPAEYFRILRELGALKVLFPELDALFGKPQNAHYHPEIDSGVHALMAIAQSARLSDDLEVRFAVLCHDLGKGLTPDEILPSHRGHEARGVPLVEAMCERLKISKELKACGSLVAEHHLLSHRIRELRPSTLLKLMQRLDAFRRPKRLEVFTTACLADARGRTGFEDDPYPQADYLRRAFAVAQSVQARDFVAQGYQGAELGEKLKAEREAALKRFKAAEAT